jgi:hypothetical protein
MVPFHRLLAAQAALLISAVLAAIIGGVAARSWLWAAGCGVLAYLAGSAVIVAWMALRLRSRGWPGPGPNWPDANWPDDDWPDDD